MTPSEFETEQANARAETQRLVDAANARLIQAWEEKEALSERIRKNSDVQKWRDSSDAWQQEAERLRTALQAAGQETAALQNEIQGLQEELNDCRGMNENLLRINRERSNADRKLQPKKERGGYILLSQESREVREKTTYAWFIATIWESVIQTPYEASVDIDAVWMMMEQEMKSLCLDRLGLTQTDMKLEEAMKQEENMLYRIEYKANYREGYWKIILFHTRPLKMIPKDFIG